MRTYCFNAGWHELERLYLSKAIDAVLSTYYEDKLSLVQVTAPNVNYTKYYCCQPIGKSLGDSLILIKNDISRNDSVFPARISASVITVPIVEQLCEKRELQEIFRVIR